MLPDLRMSNDQVATDAVVDDETADETRPQSRQTAKTALMISSFHTVNP